MTDDRPQVRDDVVPGERWEFDQHVADAFDDMLRRSIPQYEVMRDAVTAIATAFAIDGTAIVDLGCARGEAIAPIIEARGAYNRYILCDVSEPMLASCRARFAGMIDAGLVEVRRVDIRREFPRHRASVVLAVLTLQFTPIEYRRSIIEQARSLLVEGGALIVVEKVTGRSMRLHRMLDDLYLRMKADSGYTEDQIVRKRASLEGVLVPLDAGQNYAMMREAGFAGVECFWRWMNFAAWVAHR